MALTDLPKQPVTGLLPPQLGEAIIRVAWPSVAAMTAPAALGQRLMKSILGAPLAWMMLAPLYFKKILPGFATRYSLTNRRVMIQKGLKPVASQEVTLASIDEVRVVKDMNSAFYRASTMEIVSGGKVMLTLPGVPEPEAFKVAIESACMAWVPGRSAHFAPRAEVKPPEPKPAPAKPPETKSEAKPEEKPTEAKPEEKKEP